MLIITFHNDGTGTEEIDNYNVGVYVNRGRIGQARIEGHRRSDGWEELIRQFVKVLDGKDKP